MNKLIFLGPSKPKMSTQSSNSKNSKQGFLIKLCMSSYDEKQMYGFTRTRIQIPYLYDKINGNHIASEEELKKYEKSDSTQEHYIFYPKKRFVYLMYKDKPRLYIETRDIVDNKTSPIYYKPAKITWNITGKKFSKMRDDQNKSKVPVLTVVCKELDKIATIQPGTIFHITSKGKLIRENFETKGKIIINDRRKKYPFEWFKNIEKISIKDETIHKEICDETVCETVCVENVCE